MPALRSDIIHQLQRDILSLEPSGTRRSLVLDIGLGPVSAAFPGKEFPLAVIHEFIYHNPPSGAATSGFVCGILASLMKQNGASIWINGGSDVFPPALSLFGIAAEKVIF
ncbi:MAG: Error-prone repair protein ImuA, partial [Chitinophagaceae bacterium]